ncbi:MAG: division/cell wall cluster transcriptional repressor MraZ [Coriobacteriales bacterium]|jgi:MraZ protein
MAGLRGNFQHNLDAKGRIALPAPFRKVLPDKVILVKGLHEALFVFTEDEFEEWLNGFFGEGGFDQSNPRHDQIDTMIRGGSFETSIDSAGRVTIPAKLREDTHLKKSVTIIGKGGHIEMWDTDRWNEFIAEAPSLDELVFSGK